MMTDPAIIVTPMNDGMIIVIGLTAIVGIVGVLSMIFPARSSASIGIELAHIRAESICERRRVEKLKETITKYSALKALGVELSKSEYEKLRLAYNELYATGDPKPIGPPNVDVRTDGAENNPNLYRK